MKNIKRVRAAEFSRELSAKVFAGSTRLTRRGFKMGGPTAYAMQRRLVDEQCRPKGILTVGKSLLTDHVKLIPGAPDQVKAPRPQVDRKRTTGDQVECLRRVTARSLTLSKSGRHYLRQPTSITAATISQLGQNQALGRSRTTFHLLSGTG
jgi:hypothetical protein